MAETLRDARQRHGIRLDQLAQACMLPLRTLYLAECGGSIQIEEAVKILQALSYLAKKPYDFTHIHINIKACNNVEAQATFIIQRVDNGYARSNS